MKKSGGVRYAYFHYLRDFFTAHRNEYDPDIRARREAARRAAAEPQQKRGSSFWSILGGIASVAGGITSLVNGGSSETGEALTSFGEALISIDNPQDKTNDEISVNTTQGSAITKDVSSMQKRVDYIDKRIEEIGQEQIALMKQKDASKSKMMSVSGTTVKPISQSNVTRNATPSRIRQRAKTVAKAQAPYRNQQNNISERMQKMKEEKSALLAERKELLQKISEAQERATEVVSSSSSRNNDTDSEKRISEEDLKESTYAKNNIRSYQTRMDVILKELSDRKAKQEYYLNGGESMSDYRKRVKSLQKKAKDLIEEWRQKTGKPSFPTDTTLVYDWNP